MVLGQNSFALARRSLSAKDPGRPLRHILNSRRRPRLSQQLDCRFPRDALRDQEGHGALVNL